MRHLNNGTDHRHSKSCCDQSSPARRTINIRWEISLSPFHIYFEVTMMSTVPCSNTGKHDYVIWINHVTVTSHERHGVSGHGQLDCSFNRLLRPKQRKHQSSALYALMDPPVTRLVCCHTILQFKSLTEKFDFKWRHIWSNSLKHWGRAKMADIFQTTFLKARYWMKMYKFRLRFLGRLFLGVPALVQMITWRRAGDEPLTEPMMICLLTHICVTRPQWVKDCDVSQLLSTIQTSLRDRNI